MQELQTEIFPGSPEPLPFPFNQRTFCRYEPIEQRVEAARVLVINDLLRTESDISEVACREWGKLVGANLQRERDISKVALDNILNNIRRLVKKPETDVAHYSEIREAVKRFDPDAIVLSGTLSDFDYYNPEQIQEFGDFIRHTRVPVLAICGGHQLVGVSFGSTIRTLDH